MNVALATKYTRTAHRDKLLADYSYETDGRITYGGWYDAPPSLVVQLRLYRCDADPQNPYACILANLLTRIKRGLVPRELGIVMRDGIAVHTGVAYVALLDPVTMVFRHLKFEHDGHWVVRALDSMNPVLLERMWEKVGAGADVVTFRRPRPSLTKAGRTATALRPKPPKLRSVPARGVRSGGMMSVRRATANALLVEAVANAA